MRALLPYLALYKRHKWMLSLGIVLAIVTLLASIGLLTLSGWFLSASAVAGVAGLYSFNYMLPAAGVRGAAITRTAGRYFERLVSHDATFRVLQHLRIYTFSKLLPLSPAGLVHLRKPGGLCGTGGGHWRPQGHPLRYHPDHPGPGGPGYGRHRRQGHPGLRPAAGGLLLPDRRGRPLPGRQPVPGAVYG